MPCPVPGCHDPLGSARDLCCPAHLALLDPQAQAEAHAARGSAGWEKALEKVLRLVAWREAALRGPLPPFVADSDETRASVRAALEGAGFVEEEERGARVWRWLVPWPGEARAERPAPVLSEATRAWLETQPRKPRFPNVVRPSEIRDPVVRARIMAGHDEEAEAMTGQGFAGVVVRRLLQGGRA